MKQPVALLVFAIGAFAYGAEPAGDDGSSEHDGFRASADASVLLVRDSAVQAELRVTIDQAAEIARLMDEVDAALWPLRDLPPKEGDPKVLALIARAEGRLGSILDSGQHQRLEQIVLQAQGFAALLRPDMSSRFTLSDEQRKQIRAAVDITRRAYVKMDEMARQGERRALLDRAARRFREEERQKVFATLSDRQKEKWAAMTGPGFDLSRVRLPAYRAPELKAGGIWINSEPLTLAALRGKVIVVHFWTFGCGNCIANYPAYKTWHEAFAEKGVMIIGIHTPETQGEQDVEKLRRKAKENALGFPIVSDNDRRNWDAWANRVWPSVYLIDKKGRIRCWWYGELNWEGAKGEKLMRERIEALLAEKP